MTPWDAENPVEPVWTEIASRDWHSNWRQYYMPNRDDESHVPISEWIALEEGKLYPMRGTHKEGTGSDHFTVGLEYEEADSSASYNANRQIQVFEISHENVEEVWTVTVTNPDSGTYTLLFVNNEGEKTETWTSDPISMSASWWEF
jgi:hypothetical protein